MSYHSPSRWKVKVKVKKLALGRWNGGVETMHATSIRFATGNMSTFVDEDKAKARTIETKALFSCTKFASPKFAQYKILHHITSHQIFEHMYGVLNVDEIKN